MTKEATVLACGMLLKVKHRVASLQQQNYLSAELVSIFELN